MESSVKQKRKREQKVYNRELYSSVTGLFSEESEIDSAQLKCLTS